MLGDFEFSVTDKAFDALKEHVDYGFSSTDRAMNLPFLQPTKQPCRTFSISGCYVPTYKGKSTENDLKELAAKQEPQLLIAGNGDIIGDFAIMSLDFDKTYFTADGVALKVDFSIELQEAGS